MGVSMALICLSAAPSWGQAVADGVAFLQATQEADGRWQSSLVRPEQATAEVVVALSNLGAAPAARASAVTWLEVEPVADTDDRSRRVVALDAEGRNASDLVARLELDAAERGGWGLRPGYGATPLDTALALLALAPRGPAVDGSVLLGLQSLAGSQLADGGWPCVANGDRELDAELYCTAQALLALDPYRGRFFLDPQVDAAVEALRAGQNPDGSFGSTGAGGSGSLEVVRTALAARALASVPAFGQEVTTVVAFLESRQAADGSWGGDPYTTALALTALDALADVPYCGDRAINQPFEACDGLDLGGATCEGIGLGAGTLACNASCTYDASACADPPVCGDDLRNQDFEICDGLDLANQSCESQGFASGLLGCASDCRSFDVSSCEEQISCGDGVVNQDSELCDLSDLAGNTCDALGLGSGILACAPDCNLDTSQCDASTVTLDNRGREFFVGFLRNFSTSSTTAAVHLTSDEETTATVQYPAVAPSFQATVDVRPGQVTIVNLPSSSHSGWSTGVVRDNAVRLSANAEVVAYLVNRRRATSDAGMALPVDALGTSYIVSSFAGSRAYSGDRSQFLVVAPFDGTTVTITPTTSMRVDGVTRSAGTPFEIELSRGEGFRGEAQFSRTDLTGTIVEANRPVFVANGNVCTNIPSNTVACDHIFEVAHPVRSWGESVLVTNLPNRSGGSIYRVLAAEDGTEIRLDGDVQGTIDRGEHLELGPLPGRHEIDADRPIFVLQFMTGDGAPGAIGGDPAMANMIPQDQFLEEYTFSTVGGGQFASHFLTITAPDSVVGSLLLDGAPVPSSSFSAIGSSGYSSAVVGLPQGSHSTASTEPHGITVEGFNSFDSYIYPGGARLEFINQFCGDGVVNLDSETCDGNDFEGATCASFGFVAGFLQCTADCRVDTSECTGFGVVDEDDDGYPAGEDCDDTDPDVNPGMDEIPGNGIDDDCNPATPDELPTGAVACRVLANLLSYQADAVMLFESEIENRDAVFSLPGLGVEFELAGAGGVVYSEARALPVLPAGGLARQSFAVSAAGQAPGSYTASARVTGGGETLDTCSVDITLESSDTTGAGLVGSLAFDPEVVDLGEASEATYSVGNSGNATLENLEIRVLLLDPISGLEVAELGADASLAVGETFDASEAVSTTGFESNRTYLGVLLARLQGSEDEITLDTANLTVVNAPPECREASASLADLWPPNHKWRTVGVRDVTDPDGDPISIEILGVFQDERTDENGSGKTCPDARFAEGDAHVELRAERSGRFDGRVYHVFFAAEDGRGGRCEGEVTVCVPHDRREPCIDQGALHDSTVCD